MPTSADFLTAAQRFEAWWSAEFAKSTPLEVMSPTACVNTILIHLSRFLQIKKNIIEFNKHKIIPTYLAHQPPYMQPAAFACVETLLAGGDSTPAYTELLRGCVAELRSCMNTHLGIVTDP